MFRNWIVIGLLAAMGLILIGYWFSLPSVPDGVTTQGDSDEWIKSITAIAGGITTLSASIFGALSKLNDYKKAKLERVGNIPHGYELASDGVHLEPVEREQEIKRLAAELREQGMTLRQISDELASMGTFNRVGRPFNPKSISSMLKAA